MKNKNGQLHMALFWRLLVIVSIVAFGGGCAPQQPVSEDYVGSVAPAVRLTLMEGDAVPLHAYRGKKVVLFFWDTKCPRSKRVMQSLAQLAPTIAARLDVQVITVSIDSASDADAVKERVAAIRAPNILHTYSGNGLLDETYYNFGGEQIPLLVQLNRDGVIQAVSHSGSDLNEFLGVR